MLFYCKNKHLEPWGRQKGPKNEVKKTSKKQSKHYNVSVKKFVVDSNHPSGSGVKFGSAYIVHERTKGADANLVSETSLRRVFFDGIKLRSNGPVQINVNPNEVNREQKEKPAIDLLNNQSISLEPSGQIELSGKPLNNIHETCDEITNHLNQMKKISLVLVFWEN